MTKDRGVFSRLPIAFCIACAMIAGILAGCSMQADYSGLPDDHLDASMQEGIEFNHQRCGACHQGAHRGDGTFSYSGYVGGIEVWNNEGISSDDLGKEDFS